MENFRNRQSWETRKKTEKEGKLNNKKQSWKKKEHFFTRVVVFFSLVLYLHAQKHSHLETCMVLARIPVDENI